MYHLVREWDMEKDMNTHEPVINQTLRYRGYSYPIVRVSADLVIETPQGACNSDEFCTSPIRDRNGLQTVAKCVPKRRFEPMPDYNTILGRADLQEYLSGRMAFAVMSHPDGDTPMAVESMELDAGIAGTSRVGGAVGLTSQTTCENCVQLASDPVG